MKFIIDASTIQSGGGLEYLKNLVFFVSYLKFNESTFVTS